jgi:hypothetical protein
MLAVTEANGGRWIVSRFPGHSMVSLSQYLTQVPQLIRGIGVGTVKGHGGAKMSRKLTVEEGLKESKPKLTQANDQSHKPAKHIEETARLASSVETAKNPAKVRRAKD